jgi:hypothetical protein
MQPTELWLTPLILLPGVALLIVSTAARFGQLQTEVHHLLDHPEHRAEIISRRLVQRSRFYRDALAGLYASVVLFTLGSLVGGVINAWQPELLWVVGGLTIAGIGAVVFASAMMLRESMLSLQIIREHTRNIELEQAERVEQGAG